MLFNRYSSYFKRMTVEASNEKETSDVSQCIKNTKKNFKKFQYVYNNSTFLKELIVVFPLELFGIIILDFLSSYFFH